jgi:nucleotide-binding universal stress UspA family protein
MMADAPFRRMAARSSGERAARPAFEVERILVPTDFSDLSKAALERGVLLAEAFGARVTVLHVVVPSPVVLPADPALPLAPLPVQAIDVRSATRSLHAFVRPFRRAGVRIETLAREGDPARDIAVAADALSADLVVMGTHERTGLERLLLGSVAERTLRRLHCPVLTVSRVEPAIVRPGFRRILCPIDLTGASARTVEAAVALADRNAAELTFVHVLETTEGGMPAPSAYLSRAEWETLRQGGVERVRERLHAAVEGYAPGRSRVQERLAVGAPAREIVRLAEEIGADLVVIGAYATSPIARLFFGSTSRDVIREAPCPVLVIREEEPDEALRPGRAPSVPAPRGKAS